jgi:hypothetical protein
MESSTEIAQSLLNLSIAAIFASNPSTLSPIERDLSSRDFRGLAVGTVAEINVGQHNALPLLVASQIGAVRDWETPLSDNLALVSFSHQSGEVRVAKPFDERSSNRPEAGRPATRRPKPTGDAATGVATSVRSVDARKLLGLEWQTGKVSLFAVSFDMASNVTSVALTGGGDPAPATVRTISLPPRADGTGLPSYDPAVVGVKPPADGVEFSVLTHAPSGRIVVRGSLSVEALGRHVLGSPAPLAGKSVAAVVPVALLVVGRNWRLPWAFELGIPVYGNAAIAPGTRMSAALAIPVPHDGKRILPAGDYAAYVVMEGQLFGPQRFTMPAANP